MVTNAKILEQNEHHEKKSCHVGGFDNSEVFGWHLWLQACRCWLRQADEVVFPGDDAPWIRNEKRKHFGRATSIIDWYHASEHIWDCGKVLLGKRLKQCAMIWKRKGSSSVLALRVTWLNAKWKQLWKHKPLAA